MRRVPKTLAAGLVALLLVLGVAACGGGDDSDSTATEASQQQAQADNPSLNGGQNKDAKAGKGDSGSDGDESSAGPDASDFTPKQHSDSGGGSEQFRVKGGDNSIQEYGEEVEGEEFDAAAVALHNYLDARAEGNWAAACQYMSKSVVESFEEIAAQSKGSASMSCGQVVGALTNPAAKPLMKEEAAKANVGSVRIEDGRGFVMYIGVDGTLMAMPMANEDGEWKVSSLAGTPLS